MIPSVGTAVAMPAPAADLRQVTAPVDTRDAFDDAVSLERFLHELTASDARPDASRLRLLFGELAPQHRPIALQALEPYGASIARTLALHAPGASPSLHDEAQRHLTRINEIGQLEDVRSTAPVQHSSLMLTTFDSILRSESQHPLLGDLLRPMFAQMRNEDRITATAMLAKVRGSELGRLQQISTANNGAVAPAEFGLLRQLTNVDAPVKFGE